MICDTGDFCGNTIKSMSMTYNKPLTEKVAVSSRYGLKDLLTVDLFSVYLLSRVGIVIRYIEVYFTFGLPDYVRYIEEFVTSRFIIINIEVFFHTFYCNFGRDVEYRSLYRRLR